MGMVRRFIVPAVVKMLVEIVHFQCIIPRFMKDKS